MNRMLIVVPLMALMLTACVVSPTGDGRLVVAPALPVIVELGTEPYYQQGGYHYYYNNNRWTYAQSRSGPWVELPRDHYPRETRFKGRSYEHRADGRGADQNRDGRDRDGRDQR